MALTRTLPDGLSSLLRGVLMATLAERGPLGKRDEMELRLLVSQPGGKPQDPHCDDDLDNKERGGCGAGGPMNASLLLPLFWLGRRRRRGGALERTEA